MGEFGLMKVLQMAKFNFNSFYFSLVVIMPQINLKLYNTHSFLSSSPSGYSKKADLQSSGGATAGRIFIGSSSKGSLSSMTISDFRFSDVFLTCSLFLLPGGRPLRPLVIFCSIFALLGFLEVLIASISSHTNSGSTLTTERKIDINFDPVD